MTNTRQVSKGDEFIVRKSFEALLMLFWKAPFTDGVTVKLEPGLMLASIQNTRPDTTGFYCNPKNVEEFETRYVSEATRISKSYGGFAVLIMKSDIGVNVEPFTNSRPSDPQE
jgi:hypothetical protein